MFNKGSLKIPLRLRTEEGDEKKKWRVMSALFYFLLFLVFLAAKLLYDCP